MNAGSNEHDLLAHLTLGKMSKTSGEKRLLRFLCTYQRVELVTPGEQMDEPRGRLEVYLGVSFIVTTNVKNAGF